MKKILFISYGGGHVNSLLPVAKSMKSRGHSVIFFALTTAANVLKDTDIPYKTFSDYFNKRHIKDVGKTLIDTVDEKVISAEDSEIYLGQNYIDLIEEYGKTKAEKLYKKSGRLIFNPIKSMTEVIKDINPDILVTTSSPRSERASVYAANKLGIKSIALSDLFVERPLKWFSDPNFGTKICVLNSFAKETLIKNGRREQDIVITGNPAFDKLVSRSKQQKNNKKTHNRVMWASQPEPKYFHETNSFGDPKLPLKIEAELIKIFEHRKDLQLVVRNHPNEDQRDYPKHVEISEKTEDLSKALDRIDLLITCTSIVGFEALILGKGFISVDMSVLSKMLPFSKYGYSSGVNKIENIENAINDFYSNSNKIKPSYFIDDATSRICDLIHELVN